LSANARSRASPVPESDCSQKNWKHRRERSSRKPSSSLVSRAVVAADRASGITPMNARLLSISGHFRRPAAFLGLILARGFADRRVSGQWTNGVWIWSAFRPGYRVEGIGRRGWPRVAPDQQSQIAPVLRQQRSDPTKT